jgi:hypothetical protein
MCVHYSRHLDELGYTLNDVVLLMSSVCVSP